MPNPIIKQITLPSGTTYDIVDAGARELIADLQSYTDYLGVTTTELTDGATTNPIVIGGESVTAKKGNIANYGSAEFIFNGTAWFEFGDLSGLGELAFVDSVEATYTPAGSVSKPNVTITASTLPINGVSNVGTLPSCTLPTMEVTNEVLAFTAGSFSAGTLPTVAAQNVMVGATGELDAAPTFTGTQATITSAKAE